ncbi:YcjF family protein [Litchfieldia alkalitelluris]|uniref:YcjF family protein n=1 Tax=Litchfieldia alkalitelluris TaxID=304268 RepID=UPI000996FF82|nr:DUF697 domain-containing protein [Litchfieldia alkalitelluris]
MSAETKKLFGKFKEQLAKEFFEIEKNPHLSPDQKVNKVITSTALLCAGVAIQPIPFADVFILTPIQGFMGHKIAQIRGIELKEEGIWEVIKYIGGVVGLGLVAQQTAIGLFKIGLPGLGGFVTIPLVAGLTMGIGKALDLYFRFKAVGKTPSEEDIIQAFKTGKKEGRKMKRSDLKNSHIEG